MRDMLDIFDILGPVMVGPSSSHTAGAVRIGNMARALLGSQPVKADIALHGSFAETGQGHGTDRALVAGLLGMRPDNLDIPRSFEIAAEQGLEFCIHPVQLRDAHPNTAVLKVEDANGKKMTVQGVSIGGGRIIHSSQLVRINSLLPGESDYYQKEIVGVRRMLDKAGEDPGIVPILQDPWYFGQ